MGNGGIPNLNGKMMANRKEIRCDKCRYEETPCKVCQKKRIRLDRQNANRQSRDSIMRDCGLVKVRGALGGIYWE
jgi:hypothetical protein